MAERSPKHGLTRSGRGWYKRVGKRPRWIASAKSCPTGEEADAFYEANFSELAKAPTTKSAATLVQLADLFMEHKDAAGLHHGTVRDYDDTLVNVMRAVGAERPIKGLNEDDAARVMAAIAHLGTARRVKHVVNLRGFITWAKRFGIGWEPTMFRGPRKLERRRDRAKRKRPPYTPNQVRRLLRHASDRMRAVILLAFNCAMGPDEIVRLTREDVKGGVIEKARQKTGVEREIPLWAETIAALPTTPGLLFPGPDGKPLDPDRLTRRFHAVCRRACVPPRGLYHCRRTFRTLADDHGDQRAAAKVMGRELPDTDTLYVLVIRRDRIVRMLDHVKSVLRIDRGLAARRYLNGQRGLALRVARRASKAKQSAPTARTAKPRRRADQG
jgi:integrase